MEIFRALSCINSWADFSPGCIRYNQHQVQTEPKSVYLKLVLNSIKFQFLLKKKYILKKHIWCHLIGGLSRITGLK